MWGLQPEPDIDAPDFSCYLKIKDIYSSQDKVTFVLNHKYSPITDPNCEVPTSFAAIQDHASLSKSLNNYIWCNSRSVCLSFMGLMAPWAWTLYARPKLFRNTNHLLPPCRFLWLFAIKPFILNSKDSPHVSFSPAVFYLFSFTLKIFSQHLRFSSNSILLRVPYYLLSLH